MVVRSLWHPACLFTIALRRPAGVGIYNYEKLKVIRAKAALSTHKDAEKGSSGSSSSSITTSANTGAIVSASSMARNEIGAAANGRKDSSDSSYRCVIQ